MMRNCPLLNKMPVLLLLYTVLTLSILIPEYHYYNPCAVLKEYCIISPYILARGHLDILNICAVGMQGEARYSVKKSFMYNFFSRHK